MNAASLAPKPDQVAELTRGLILPLPPITDEVMLVLAESLIGAFEDVRKSAPATLATGSEPEVTALLQARLNRMIDDDALWRTLVLYVGRGVDSVSFDGSHIEKKPDLSISLSDRSARFPLAVEAKLIDCSKGKTETLYCAKGVKRFLDGEYGWGGREGFMLAYVRDGSTIAAKLAPHLTLPASSSTYALKGAPTALTLACDGARTHHDRGFVYTHVSAPANMPGSIELWHIWLDASDVGGS
ncbi:hypothetical protein [Sphingosinicella terrae]|uniref:hypothetical protein n=1 Tax=Sphingosinicella terrae TaxID=2172047 RepID=UPI000E0CD680|nr:hypothetical protein [Sphingosinicella terrae]